MAEAELSSNSSNTDSETSLPKNKVKRIDPDSPHLQRGYWWEGHRECGFPHRVNHAAASFVNPAGSHSIISVGGYHADVSKRLEWRASFEAAFQSAPIDVFAMDVESRGWAEVVQAKEVKSPLQCPTPRCRYGHSICYFGGRLYMYGGRNDDDLSFHTVECYDIAENIWFKIRSPNGPDGLCGQAACVLGNTMYIHGGYAEKQNQFSTSFWAFDFETRTWRELKVEGDYVRERDFHSITPVGTSLYVFGGRSDASAPIFSGHSVYDNQFYRFDTITCKWTTLKTSGYTPSGRRSHVAEAYGNHIIFFGGYNAHLRKHFGDLFLLDTITCNIMEVRPWGDFPSPRRRMCSARIGSEFIIFGGTHHIELESNGHKVNELEDLSEMFVLYLLPSLEQLCLMAVIKHNLPRSVLPPYLRERISAMESASSERDKMLKSSLSRVKGCHHFRSIM